MSQNCPGAIRPRAFLYVPLVWFGVAHYHLVTNKGTTVLIACDVDGILAALLPEWIRRYNRDYQDNLTLDRITGWDVHRFVKPECGMAVYGYLQAPDLYDGVAPVEDAAWGVQRLRELGHQLIFATSCSFGMTDQKAHWMIRWGFCQPNKVPDMLPEDFAPISQKHLLKADLLIEDAGHTVRKWVMEVRRRAILLEYPHNRDLDLPSMFWGWCKRVPDWSGIVQHVEELGA